MKKNGLLKTLLLLGLLAPPLNPLAGAGILMAQTTQDNLSANGSQIMDFNGPGSQVAVVKLVVHQ